MFHRYQYTCPDVIHVRKIQKRVAYTSIGVQAAFWLGLWAMAQSSKKDTYTPVNTTETPTE